MTLSRFSVPLIPTTLDDADPVAESIAVNQRPIAVAEVEIAGSVQRHAADGDLSAGGVAAIAGRILAGLFRVNR